MALDGAFLYTVKNELKCLLGGRVDKIYEPSREEIIISMRTKNGGVKLLLSASASSARVHITENKAENPKSPPMFCMLMRKHLNCAKLTDIRQDKLERILFLDFEAVNELGDLVKITVAAEIMGKYSNIILINENGKIIDSLKRVDSEMSRERLILPGMVYSLPPREERLCFLDCSAEDIKASFRKILSSSDCLLSKAVIRTFEGVSPLVAREWTYRASGNADTVLSEGMDKYFDGFIKAVFETRDKIFDNDLKYVILRDENKSDKDFCFFDISQYDGIYDKIYLDSASEILDRFYAERDSFARMKQRFGDMYKLIKNTRDRISKRLYSQKEELQNARNRDEYKLKGDLISANIYKLEKGMGFFETENFYDESCPVIKIELDRRLSPSQNMQKYYSEYRKADTAEKILTERIAHGEEELSYIESVSDALSRAETEDDINALREELAGEGYLKRQGKKQKNPKILPPKMFLSPDGFEIAIGRNNVQNDKLTLKTAEKTDIWLHTKDIPGSHVIIFAHGKNVPDSTIMYAAKLAAFHSKARGSSQVPVDYVPVRLVKKPAGSKPGKVIFTGNKTLYVQPLDVKE